jgi:hypothetical protein
MTSTSLDQLIGAVIHALRDAENSLKRRPPAACAHLAEFSMAFDFRLRYRRVARRRRELVMQLGRPRFPWLDRRPVHRLTLVCLATTAWQPRLEIDGLVIDLRDPS